MIFIAESITSFYDQEQDRLNLVFNGKDRKQLIGLVTRQFFKGLLARLPDWLARQRIDTIPLTTEQQRIINQFHHQVSQQEVTVTYGKAPPSKQIETFLINTINFTKTKVIPGSADQKIRLEFLGPDRTAGIMIVLDSARLHKFIGEILKQVQAWDLDNPWQDKSGIFASFDNDDQVVH
jgi:hypothetical protein